MMWPNMSGVPRLRDLGLSYSEEFSFIPNGEFINPLPSQDKNCVLKTDCKGESSIVCLKIWMANGKQEHFLKRLYYKTNQTWAQTHFFIFVAQGKDVALYYQVEHIRRIKIGKICTKVKMRSKCASDVFHMEKAFFPPHSLPFLLL